MKAHRLARVNEVVRETVASAILFDLKDPRVKNVTVTRAEVSADLQHAKIFVSVMGTEKEQQLTMHGLKSAAGYVQKKVGDQLTTRYVPHITFVLDEGVKKSIEIARLIREAKGEPPPAAADEIDDETETEAAGEGPPPADAVTRPGQPGAADGPANPPG
jgi:ribosome-binding factor A